MKVVDSIGAAVVNECLAALTFGGEVATLGLFDVDAPALDLMALIGKQASVRGIAVGSAQMHRDLTAFMEAHDVHPIIDRRYAFDDLPLAYDDPAAAPRFGKTVVELGDD